MYLTNDELNRLADVRARQEALSAIADSYDCSPVEIVAAIAIELLTMRRFTGVDASRLVWPTARGRR
jgi:hypothetical protein